MISNLLQKNTFEYSVPGARRRIQAKIATKLGGKSKGSSNKTILSKHNRLRSKIHITSNSTAMVSGHGKTRAYIHRFKLLESATCPCNKGDQTTDHLLYHCTLLQQQSEILEKDTLKFGIWPIITGLTKDNSRILLRTRIFEYPIQLTS